MFVVVGGAIQVIENASQSESFVPDWTLFEDDEHSINYLATDGVTLFGARGGSGWADWIVATWPLSVAEPTPADALDAGPPGQIYELFPIPSGGVIAAAEHSIYSWALEPGDPQAPTAYLLTPQETWRNGVASQANRIYTAGEKITVFASPLLGDPSELAPTGADALALIER